jgi:alcohol dehydrogenase class IV
MHAATMAGWVQNLKLPGIGHAVAHQLGRFGVSHGRAVGCLLPSALRFNLSDALVAAKYDRLARACGLDGAQALPDAVEALLRELNVASLHLNCAEVELDQPASVAGALADPCARANPRQFEASDVADLLAGQSLKSRSDALALCPHPSLPSDGRG